MPRLRLAPILIAAVVAAPPVAAQTASPDPAVRPVQLAPQTGRVSLSDASDHDVAAPRVKAPQSFLSPIGRDFATLFSRNTLRAASLVAMGALTVSSVDRAIEDEVQRSWPKGVFEPGQTAGNFLFNLGGGAGAYLIGRTAGSERVATIGADLMRAQILSQAVAQAGKLTTRRSRPDSSNDHSLPSGHAASAFATAGVLHRHFGWKAGVPAYLFAGYVGTSRMAANRHYLSDVVLGAGLGLISARVVTMPLGRADFNLNVAPIPGGAAVTFRAE